MFVFSTRSSTNNPGLPKIYEPKDEVKDEFRGELACGLKPKSINQTGGQVALGFFESSTSQPGLARVPVGGPEVELSVR